MNAKKKSHGIAQLNSCGTTASLLTNPANPKYANKRAIPNPPITVRIKCIRPRVTPNYFVLSRVLSNILDPIQKERYLPEEQGEYDLRYLGCYVDRY